MINRLLLVLLLSVSVALPASAERLFKTVDEDGNVTYQSFPPSDGSGTSEQRDIYGGEDPEDDFINRDRAALNYPVTLYAIANCKPCDNARTQLTEREIPFDEKDPTSSPELYKTFKELVNGTSVPALSVGTNVISHYTKDNLKQALDTAGYPPLRKEEPKEDEDSIEEQ